MLIGNGSTSIIPDPEEQNNNVSDAKFIKDLARKAALADEVNGKKFEESYLEYSKQADLLQEGRIRNQVSNNAVDLERSTIMKEWKENVLHSTVEDTVNSLQRLQDIEQYEAQVEDLYVERLSQFRNKEWFQLDEENVNIMQRRKERLANLEKLHSLRAKYAAQEEEEGWFGEMLDALKAVTGIPNLLDSFNLIEGTPAMFNDEMKKMLHHINQLPAEQQTEEMKKFAQKLEDASWLLDNNQDVVDKIDLILGDEQDMESYQALAAIDLIAMVGIFKMFKVGKNFVEGGTRVSGDAIKKVKVEDTPSQATPSQMSPLAQAIHNAIPSGKGITKPVTLNALGARQVAGAKAVAKDIVDGAYRIVSPDDFLDQAPMLRSPASAYGESLSPYIEQAAKINQHELLLHLDEFAAPERLATVLARSTQELQENIIGRGILGSSFEETSGKIMLQIGTVRDAPFKSKKNAQAAIERLNLKNIKGIQSANAIKADDGWIINIVHTEGDPLKAWQELGWIGKGVKNIQDVVPAFAKLAQQSDDAHRAVNKAIENVFTRDLRSFVGKKGAGLKRVIENMQKEMRSVLDPVSGKMKDVPADRWYSVDEFIAKYDELSNKMPTQDEVKAFIAYRQLNDFAYELKVKTMAETVVARGDSVYPIPTPSGRVINTLGHPVNHNRILGDTNREAILLNGENTKYFAKGKMTDKDVEELSNYDIISIHPSHREDFYRIGEAEAPIRYMAIPRGVKSRDFVPTDISNYLGAGRIVDTSPFFIKVGRIVKDSGGQTSRLSDTTLFAASSANDAKKGARQINQLADLMRANVDDLGKLTDDIIEKIGLGKVGIRTVDEAHNFMKTRGLYASDTKIGHVADREILDMGDVGNFRDVDYSQISNNSRSQIMGMRTEGLQNIRGVDSSHADPMAALVKSMNIVAEYSSTTALRERALAYFHKNFFKDIDTNSSNPYDMLFANVSKGVQDSNPAKANAIQAHQKYLRTMLSFRTSAEASWDNRVERMFAGFFDTKDRIFSKGSSLSPQKMVDKLEKRQRTIDVFGRDPLSKIKTLTFHNTLGMLNPASFIMQAINIVNIAAVAGRAGMKAGLQALPLRTAMLTKDPEAVSLVARNYSKFGFNSQREVEELVEEFWLSGLDSVGSTHMLAQGISGLQLVGHGKNRLKNLSTMFFDQGEILNRITARTAASHEWRKANPNISIKDPEARKWIGGRMHDLTLGMSRSDTQLLLREGALSLPTQFWSYPMRLTHALMPKKWGGSSMFTANEQWRLAAVQIAMWGGSGIPLVGFMTNHLVENNDMDEGVAKLVSNGVFDASIYALSGGEMDTNMSDRVGLHEFYAPIFDGLLGDKTALEVIGGASASRGTQMFGAAEAAFGILQAGSMTDPNLLTDASVRGLAGMFSGANNMTKFYLAMKYGKLFSRNGNAMANITTPESFAMLLGIPPQIYADISMEYKANEADQDLKASIKERYIRALTAIEEADTDEEFQDAIKRIEDLSVLTHEEGFNQLLSTAIKEKGGGTWQMRQGERIIRAQVRGKRRTKGQERRAKKTIERSR